MRYSKSILINPEELLKIILENNCDLEKTICKAVENNSVISSHGIKQYLIEQLPEEFVDSVPSDMSDFFHQSIDVLVFRIINALAGGCLKNDCETCKLSKCCVRKK